MNKLKPVQYKFLLIFIAGLAVSIFMYVEWVAINFNIQHAKKESRYLSDFSDRAISRIRANPSWFPETGKVDGKALGNHRLSVTQNYDELKQRFPEIPEESEMQHNKMFVVAFNLRGLLKVPNFIIIKPVFLPTGEKFFGYLHVDAELNDEYLDNTLAEELQPVLLFAMGSILIMFIIQLKHINSINNTAMAMANWADNLNTSSSSTPLPNFQVPRLNHIAFTINKSLSTLGQVLEKEQSFAKYTSHELRTPIAALSANIELLEMMMQDLSPKERQVLKRIETAIADMKYQIDALLWMSKEIEIDSEFKACEVRGLVEKSITDNNYLVAHKPVKVNISNTSTSLKTHPILFQIVINNLVRNAFQNTQRGSVDIDIQPNVLIVSNTNDSLDIPSHKGESFGIGLVLVEKLISKLSIEMTTATFDSGRKVSLIFSEENT